MAATHFKGIGHGTIINRKETRFKPFFSYAYYVAIELRLSISCFGSILSFFIGCSSGSGETHGDNSAPIARSSALI